MVKIHKNSFRVKWIQVQGTKYIEGSVVVLGSTEILPAFGLIIDILITKVDNPYFVCEVLYTEEFSVHFHSFVITRQTPIPISFCTPDEHADHHTLGLYSLRLVQDTHPSLFIVLHYNLI